MTAFLDSTTALKFQSGTPTIFTRRTLIAGVSAATICVPSAAIGRIPQTDDEGYKLWATWNDAAVALHALDRRADTLWQRLDEKHRNPFVYLRSRGLAYPDKCRSEEQIDRLYHWAPRVAFSGVRKWDKSLLEYHHELQQVRQQSHDAKAAIGLSALWTEMAALETAMGEPARAILATRTASPTITAARLHLALFHERIDRLEDPPSFGEQLLSAAICDLLPFLPSPMAAVLSAFAEQA